MSVKLLHLRNLTRVFSFLFLAFGVFLSTNAIETAQAARADTVKVKKAKANFNKKVKVRKFRARAKSVRRLARRKHTRSKTRSLRRAPAKRHIKSQSRRTYRGLHPRLRLLLSTVRRHYGRPVVISSGCRSRKHNRRIGGAKRSMHLRCMAADIKVSGVSKSRLRRYLTRLSGRGGVGTYCGRSIVHLDVGPRRSWYHGCRKRKRRTRKS